MHLLQYRLSPPTNKLDFDQNIDRMIEGRPFWSIAPVELGAIPLKMAEEALTIQDTVYDKYQKLKHKTMRLVILSCLENGLDEWGGEGYFEFRVGKFRHDTPQLSQAVHVDGPADGYRGTARSVVASYPEGTLAFEGPMQVMLSDRVKTRNPKTLVAMDIQSADIDIVPLDNQDPVIVKPATASLLTECTAHLEPPTTNEMRWFARMFLYSNDLYSRRTDYTEDLYNKLTGSRS